MTNVRVLKAAPTEVKPKLCKDCKWAHRAFLDKLSGSWFFTRCHHPDAQLKSSSDMVCGDPLCKMPFCDLERSFTNRPCGPEGKLWEPKRKS